jgi:hypothetical protein
LLALRQRWPPISACRRRPCPDRSLRIAWALYEQMEQRKVNGTPPLTPADVRAQMDAYLVSEYDSLLPDFQLVYLKGALLREIAWQDDIKHYDEDPTIHTHLPDWHPLLSLVEQTLQADQQRTE